MWAATTAAAPLFEYSGYYKNLAAMTDVGGDLLLDDYQRLRLKARYEQGDWLQVDVDYELTTAWGDTTEQYSMLSRTQTVAGGAMSAALAGRPRLLNLESDIVDDDRFRLRHGLDRARVRLINDRLDFSIGRQSVSWGTGMFWAPTDLFSGFSPTEIDRDEKPGVDVVRLTISLAEDTALDLVFEPLDMDDAWSVDANDSAGAARLTAHAGEYDLSASGGYVAGDWVSGGDFSGYIGNAGLHGEMLYTWVAAPGGSDYLKCLAGADYSFSARGQPYVMVEYYYNGAGDNDSAGYAQVFTDESVQRSFVRGTAYNIGRHYCGALMNLTLTPLLALSSQTIVNMEDSSANEFLMLSWSTSDNTDVLFGGSLAIGGDDTEFGGWLDEATGMGSAAADFYFTYFKAYF